MFHLLVSKTLDPDMKPHVHHVLLQTITFITFLVKGAFDVMPLGYTHHWP